jgi:hypothetical protein
MATHPHPAPLSNRAHTSARVSALSAIASAPYWLLMIGVYAMFGFLWYYAAKEKLIDQSGTMPAGLAKGFQGSFLDSFPGLNAAWVLLGALEAVAFVLFVVSLFAGEFLPSRRKPILVTALAFSVATFAAMAFAENSIADHASVASLFTYMVGSVVVLGAVVAMTPARVKAWIASITADHEG